MLDKSIGFKQIVSGPANLDQILEHIKKIGDQGLEYDASHRSADITTKAYAWTAEFMRGLGLCYVETTDSGKFLVLSETGNIIYNLIKDMDIEALKKDVNNTYLLVKNNHNKLYNAIKNMFISSEVYTYLNKFLTEKNEFKWEQASFYKEYYSFLNKIFNNSDDQSGTGINRVPSLIIISEFCGMAIRKRENDSNIIIFDKSCFVNNSSLVYKTNFKSEYSRNRIVFGAPGTGKSYKLRKETEDVLVNCRDNFERVTFHPDYSYAQFVGTYKPTMGDDGISIRYDFVPGPFMRIYVKAMKSAMSDTPEPYVLIIEEINRARVASVFGDVFQLLDRDEYGVSEYEIQASEDIKKYLAKELGGKAENYNKISIPNNMFIWATMNSADQGVFSMDTAFKRRWSFEYLGINSGENAIKGIGKIKLPGIDQLIEWNTLRRAINEKMLSGDFRINEDKLLGPFFLSKKLIESDNEGKIIDTDKFIATFKSKVLMYLYEDAVKQNKHSFFEGCGSTYSSVCEAFDKRGIQIFGSSFKEDYYDTQRADI